MKKLLLYLGILASSLCFFLIFVVAFLNGTVATCTRQADETYTCKIQTLFLGKIPTLSRNIEQIVDVVTEDDGCFEGCSYRTEFVLKNGSTKPLSDVYTDRNPVNQQTSELHGLIVSGKDSFEFKKDPPWWVLLLIGGLFIMEFFIVTFTTGISGIREFIASRKSPA